MVTVVQVLCVGDDMISLATVPVLLLLAVIGVAWETSHASTVCRVAFLSFDRIVVVIFLPANVFAATTNIMLHARKAA